MPRPAEYEDLTHTTITLPMQLKKEALRIGINISDVCRSALAAAINNPEIQKPANIREKFKKVPKERMNKIRRLLDAAADRDKAAEVWAKWIKENFELEVTAEELLEYVVHG